MSKLEDQSKGEWGSDLGLFLSGLFNFYQFAAFEVKDQFLTIIDQYILSFDKELLLSLPGFMICMLPALEDQNADKLKKVDEILRKTEQAVGTSEFYGEIWKAMLRTNRTRLSAIKYLEKRIPRDLEAAREMMKKDQIYISRFKIKVHPIKTKEGMIETRVSLDKDIQREEEERKHLALTSLDDYFYFYYPMKEKLFVNALLAGLADQSIYVNRGVVDFLITHAPISGKINKEIENVKLVEGALYTLHRKDFAFLKKFFTWTLGHLEDDDDYKPNDQDPAIKTLVPALKCLFKKFLDKNELLKHTQKDKVIQQSPQNIPILITTILLNDNSMIIEPILLQVSVEMIKYIKFYINDKKDPKNRFIDNVKNLFDMLTAQLNCIWIALGELLSKEIDESKIEGTYQVQAIELIDFCLRDLRHCFEKNAESNFCDYLRPILSTLLSGVNKLSNGMFNLENVLPALQLIENIISVLDQKGMDQQKDQEMIVNLQGSVNNFNSFYVELCNAMISPEDIMDTRGSELFKLKLQTFKKASQILTQIQEYSSVQQLNVMPQWLVSIINCSKTRRAKIALVSTETFLNILSKECTKSNDPVKKLQNLIVNSGYEAFNNGDPQPMSSESSLVVNRSITPNRNIYQILQETRNYHCTDIIKTLWYLLDEEEDHQKIVILLKKFDGLLPAIFSEVVINDLKEKAQREVKERGIKKFSIFWNLTSFDYPNYRPFYEKDTSDRRYGALHNVLHFLEQNDPTLRLSCRSWLSESKYFYNRILDPLIEEFLQNSKVFVTFTKQIFFYDMYDTKIVSENFGKLRNIILNTQDEMIKYMINNYTSDYVQKEFLDMFDWMLPVIPPAAGQLPQTPPNKRKQHKYLEIIVYITLQFIMGQAVQSVDNGLYQESQTVNASACEFMELILKSLESHPETSNKIAHIIVDPILRTFKQVIDNQNHAMQVHLLNLLKVIFFQCNFNIPESKDNCERIFKDLSLIDSIIKGMKNEVSFVRYHFIQFATSIMETMKKLLKAVDFTRNITKLIDCFCDLMNHVDVTLFNSLQQSSHSVFTGGDQDGKGSSSTQLSAYRRTSVAPSGENTHKAQGTFVINQESDIAQLIQGFKKILSDALSIYKDKALKTLETNTPNAIMGDQVLDNSSVYKQAEGTSLLGKVSKLFGGGGDSPIIVNTDEQVIREAIYNDFKKIIVACLHCWNNLSIFTPKDFHFTRSGVFPFTNQDEIQMGQIMEQSYIKFKEQNLMMQMEKFNDSRSTQGRETLINNNNASSSQPQQGFTSGDYIKMKTNSIQIQVLDFLRPLTDTSSNQLIEGILLVWMDKKNLDSTTNMHKNLEKIMQILQSVKVKYYHVVECINNLIEKQKWKTVAPKSKKKLVLTRKFIQKETLLCQFLYSYLLYNVQQLFTKGDEISVTKLYKAVLKFAQNLKESRHPLTQCWLLEILNILSIKFSPMEAYRGDQKLKKDYFETLTDLITASSNILSDNYKAQFEENYGFLIAFPPHIYELLKRFSPKMSEYTSTSIQRASADTKNGGFTASQSVMQTQQQLKKPFTASGGGGVHVSASSAKKPGQIQQQAKMQPLNSHNPPEDVDDEDDISGTSAQSIGIGQNYGLKLGRDPTSITVSSFSAQSLGSLDFTDQNEYPNNDFFFEEGNSTSKFMLALAGYINYPQQICSEQMMTIYQRFFTIVTLKGVLFNTVQSIVGGASASHTAFEKIQGALKIVVDEILKILSKKELPGTGVPQGDKSGGLINLPYVNNGEYERAFIREVITDFFASLMDSANMYLVKRYKPEISEIFFSDTFFQMSRRNLRKWCKIINHVISDHKDAVFDDLLYKWNTQAGLLTSKETENKQKIIALKRVSFLVFSGNVDQYDDKLDQLLKKMTEGLKMGANKKFPELQRQLFLLTRVLLLRLQTTTLTDALRKLWPHLLNELESIFRDKDSTSGVLPGGKDKAALKEKQDAMNLVFEAIKVIELMSALNIEDFQMNQWIFLVDSYGMHLDNDSQSQTLLQRKPQATGSSGDHDFQMLDKSEISNGGIFQPSILRFLPPNSLLTFYDQSKQNGFPLETDPSKEVENYVRENLVTKQIEQRRSSIQVDPCNYDQDHVLETFALNLQIGLAVLNTERTEIDKQNFEALIEKDFIELDTK